MTPYQIKQQKRRTVLSFVSAFLLHLLLFGGALLYSWLFVEDMTEFSGPVLVKLGEPEGADLPLTPEPAEETSAPEQPPAAEEVPPPAAEEPESPEAVLPSPPEEPAEKPEPPVEKPEPSPEAVPEEPAAEPADIPEKPVEPQPEPEPVPIKGSEAGNAHETVLATGEGSVGRNIWRPIYLYLPLPRELDVRFVEGVQASGLNSAEENRTILLRYYEMNPLNGGYLLSRSVSFDERPFLWLLLEQAGYDTADAEYKKDRSLRPVIISFTVIPDTGELMDVFLKQSSGYGELDEAVLYGFRASEYFNRTNRKIKGRFTYRFD